MAYVVADKETFFPFLSKQILTSLEVIKVSGMTKKKLLSTAPTCFRKVLWTKFSKHDAKFVSHTLSNAQKQLPWQTDKYHYTF